MSENANIIQAVVQQWRRSTAVLSTIPITSTRVPHAELAGIGGVNLPYCLVENKILKHLFHSGKERLTWYRVTLTVYVGQDKTQLVTISDAIAGLFDWNIGLPVLDNCVVLAAIPEVEDPFVAPDDYYGEDVNVLRQLYKILMSETTLAVRTALAT